MIYGFDFDGVISLGINPGPKDVIITGRCIDEQEYVLRILRERGITNDVYFNQMTLEERGNHTIQSRIYSGIHKAKTISKLKSEGIIVSRFFEDDEIQKEIIISEHPEIELIFIQTNLVEK